MSDETWITHVGSESALAGSARLPNRRETSFRRDAAEVDADAFASKAYATSAPATTDARAAVAANADQPRSAPPTELPSTVFFSFQAAAAAAAAARLAQPLAHADHDQQVGDGEKRLRGAVQPVYIGEDVIVPKLGEDGARDGAKHERQQKLEPEQRPRRHLHFGLAEVIQERQVREKGRAEEVALDELPLFRGHAEGVDRGGDDLGGDRASDRRVAPRRWERRSVRQSNIIFSRRDGRANARRPGRAARAAESSSSPSGTRRQTPHDHGVRAVEMRGMKCLEGSCGRDSPTFVTLRHKITERPAARKEPEGI
jgi:hypothetical protein